MRDSLTILAIALIVVLTTALVGPYFVDWNSHRATIEMRLSALLGAKVTVGGPIDVKLLPRPIFRMQAVAVAGRAPQDPTAAVARLDVELALTALLRGEFVFVDADLTQPRLTLTMGQDGAVALPRFAATDPDHVSINHVAIHDGAVVLVDAAGKTLLAAAGLSGDGTAESLTGPFRFAGQLDTPRGALSFHIGTGALDNGRLRVKAATDALAGLPKSDVEGTLALRSMPGGAFVPSFEGIVATAGALPLTGTASLVPWTLGAHLQADAERIEIGGIDLRAGADARALAATGDGRILLGAAPKAAVVLHARQLDIPRLVVAPDGSAPAPSTADDVIAGLRRLAVDPDAAIGLPLPMAIDYTVDAVTLGQQTLTGLAGRLDLAPDASPAGMMAIGAPDGSRLALDGTLEPGAAAVFKGRMDFSSRDIGRLADNLAADLPDAATLLRRALPTKAVAFHGGVDLSGVGVAARDIDLTLDRSRFAGTITFTRTVGQDQARLFADVTAEALDLDALPDWRDAASAATDIDLDLSLSARAVRIGETDTGGVSTGRVALQLTKSGTAITLDRLALADIGGATADFRGRSDGNTAHVEGHLDARRLGDLLAVVRKLAPGAATDALLARAAALSPALLTIVVDGGLDDTNTPRLRRLSLDGTAAGTALELHLAPAPPSAFAMTLRLDAPEAGALLRQFGIATTATTAIGRSRIEADSRLDNGFAPTDGGLTATLADTVLTLRGRRDDKGARSGRMSLKGSNVAPLLRAVQLAAPEAGAAWPAEAAADLSLRDGRLSVAGLAGQAMGTAFKGSLAYRVPRAETAASTMAAGTSAPEPALTGNVSIDRVPLPVLAALALGPLPPPATGAVWPDAPFAPGFLTLPRTEVALSVATLPLTATATAREAALTLGLGPGLVSLSSLSAKLGDGRLGATLALRRNGPSASLGGRLEWEGIAAATPALGGRSRGALDLAATGSSLATLAASLAGSGTLGVDDARLPRLDAAALGRVVADTGLASSDIDGDAIRQSIAQNLDRGALALGTVSTPVTVAAGVIRGDPLAVDGPIARTLTTAALDLRSLALSMTTTMTLRQPPKDWVGAPPAVTVVWKGPFSAPAREIDAASLVNGIAARAIARDQARIEAFQDDIRERAFFARRLRLIEAEQQEKADAANKEAMQKLLQALPSGAPPPKPQPPRPAPVKAPLDLTPGAAPPAP